MAKSVICLLQEQKTTPAPSLATRGRQRETTNLVVRLT